MLHEFLTANRDELISRCRIKVGRRTSPQATDKELQFGIPLFLTELTHVLRDESKDEHGNGDSDHSRAARYRASTGIGESATSHGSELLREGYTVDQVVRDYGDLCQAITELAIELRGEIEIDEFQTLNRCLDDAIAGAVSEFARKRDRESLGFLAHEFRNLINTAMLAMNAIKLGKVGMAGSTGDILDRSLKGLLDLCSRALDDVRQTDAASPKRRERVLVSEFIDETHKSAAIDAKARGLELVVSDVDPGLAIEIDRQVLAGAVANLLQNAFKFSRPQGRVSLRAFSSAHRIMIEVEDQCGGLPPGNAEDLFRLFEQRSTDRTGLGLGLGISRRGVEANGGRLNVRDLPGKGCVFTINLPKAAPDIQVLLVEDSPGDVRLTQEAFHDVNMSIRLHVVCDGVEAMAFLRREGAYANAPRPELILLDLNLPKMDGREVLASIKEDDSLKTIPTVILTTSEARPDILKSYRLQANCYLIKPVHLDEFENLIRSINDFWLTKVRLPQE